MDPKLHQVVVKECEACQVESHSEAVGPSFAGKLVLQSRERVVRYRLMGASTGILGEEIWCKAKWHFWPASDRD